jgi:hypothetical protein
MSSQINCSDLCLATSMATSMAFQVRATNKMNENIWHPKPPQITKKMLRKGLSGPVTVWT